MTANTVPIFTLTPNTARLRLSAANTARDGSGTIGTAFTAGSNGSRVDRITFTSAQATAAANSAMVGRVFVSDTSGANYRLYQEIVISAVTASNTVVGARSQIVFPGGLMLLSGQLVGAIISVYAGAQDQIDVVTEGGDY